jgi:hypothetical protein
LDDDEARGDCVLAGLKLKDHEKIACHRVTALGEQGQGRRSDDLKSSQTKSGKRTSLKTLFWAGRRPLQKRRDKAQPDKGNPEAREEFRGGVTDT